jgi:RPA family protein
MISCYKVDDSSSLQIVITELILKMEEKTIKLYDTNLFLVRWQKIYEFNQTQHPSLRKERGGEKKARRNNQEGTLDPLLDLFACSFKNHHVCANKQAWQHSAS